MAATRVSEAAVRAEVLRHVGETLEARGLTPADVPDDFDLVDGGLVDSFGFLELVGAVEATFGVEVDFAGVDPDQMTQLGPFAAYVAAQAPAAGSDDVDAAATTEPPAPTTSEPVRGDEAPSRPTRMPMRASGPVRRATGTAAAGAYGGWIRLRDKLFSVLASGSFASFGDHTVIQLPVRLKGQRRIAVGRDAFIGANSWLQVLDEAPEGTVIEIGDGASFAGHNVISAAHSVRIGSDVSFARGVYVADHTHEYTSEPAAESERGLTDIAAVEIGDGAWLGENVMVLPGVRIGARAVVAANAVVTRDVPDHSVVAGAPARVVRRFTPGQG